MRGSVIRGIFVAFLLLVIFFPVTALGDYPKNGMSYTAYTKARAEAEKKVRKEYTMQLLEKAASGGLVGLGLGCIAFFIARRRAKQAIREADERTETERIWKESERAEQDRLAQKSSPPSAPDEETKLVYDNPLSAYGNVCPSCGLKYYAKCNQCVRCGAKFSEE